MSFYLASATPLPRRNYSLDSIEEDSAPFDLYDDYDKQFPLLIAGDQPKPVLTEWNPERSAKLIESFQNYEYGIDPFQVDQIDTRHPSSLQLKRKIAKDAWESGSEESLASHSSSLLTTEVLKTKEIAHRYSDYDWKRESGDFPWAKHRKFSIKQK